MGTFVRLQISIWPLPHRRAWLSTAARYTAAGAALLFLAGSIDAQTQPSISALLAATGQFVEHSTRSFGRVVCLESVSQTKLGPNGKVLAKQDSEFDYQVQVDINQNDLFVRETATPHGPVGKSKNVPLLVTQGFTTLLLIFHPMYQQDFEYAFAQTNGDTAPGIVKVHFEHVHGTASPSVLRLRGQDFPLDLQGTAWIEESSGTIQRIETDLMAPMSNVGLQVFHSDVSYMPSHFSGVPQPYWLPVMAEMDAESPHQHWQNFYRFTNYRIFSATMKIEFPKKP